MTFIQWPSGDEAISIMQDFEAASGFPGVIGAIDGTDIRINAPKENPADYINRKGYYSIQLQVGKCNIKSQSYKCWHISTHTFICSWYAITKL